MVAEVVCQHVVAGVGQVLVLDDEVDLDRFDEVAPRLAHMSGIAGAVHRKGMVEDDEFVALAAFAGIYQASSGVPSSDGMDRSCQPSMPYSSGFLKMKLRGIFTMPASALTLA